MTISSETTTEFKLGDQVKIDGENGYYWVIGSGKDGSVSLWGGDKDPNGYRQNRAVMPERLKPDSRKISRKSVPELEHVQSE